MVEAILGLVTAVINASVEISKAAIKSNQIKIESAAGYAFTYIYPVYEMWFV